MPPNSRVVIRIAEKFPGFCDGIERLANGDDAAAGVGAIREIFEKISWSEFSLISKKRSFRKLCMLRYVLLKMATHLGTGDAAGAGAAGMGATGIDKSCSISKFIAGTDGATGSGEDIAMLVLNRSKTDCAADAEEDNGTGGAADRSNRLDPPAATDGWLAVVDFLRTLVPEVLLDPTPLNNEAAIFSCGRIVE